MIRRTNGGGVAEAAGGNYQNRVAAWFAVRILAEREAELGLGLPVDARPSSR